MQKFLSRYSPSFLSSSSILMAWTLVVASSLLTDQLRAREKEKKKATSRFSAYMDYYLNHSLVVAAVYPQLVP
jgi:hypothetical protein